MQRLITVIVLLGIAVGGVALAFNEADRYRVLTTDSIMYVDTARHIAAGQGATTNILTLNDSTVPAPQTQYPPFYAMVMSPFVHFGLDSIFAGRIVSALSFGLLILLIGLWGWRLGGRLTGVASSALVAAFPAIISISSAVLADSLYAVLVTGLAWLGCELAQKKYRWHVWFALGVLIGLGMITKYLGLLLFGVLVVIILFSLRQQKHLFVALKQLLIALAGILIFLGPLLARNAIHKKPIGGAVRTLSTQPLGQIFHDLWTTVSDDLTVNKLWVALLVLTAAALIILFIKKRARTSLAPIALPVTIAIVYWLGLVAARVLIDTDRIHTRFTMPVYPLIVLAIVFVIHKGSQVLNKRTTAPALVALVLLALAWSTKRYDFSAGSWQPNLSSRTVLISQLTTPRDLIIGNASREYNLFLDRSVIQLDSDPKSPALTMADASLLRDRWSPQFDRILLAVSPDLDRDTYGDFVASLSHQGAQSPLLQLVDAQPSLVVYQIL